MSAVGLLMITAGLPTNLGSVVIGKGTSGVPDSHLIGFKSGTMGSVTPTTDPIYSAGLTGIYWDEAATTFYLKETGTLANSGWSSFTLQGGTSFSRAAATFSTTSGTSWSWAQGSDPWVSLGNVVTGYWL